MILSFVLWDGLALLATGVALLLRGKRSGLVAIGAGLAAIGAAIGWPVKEERSAGRTQKIDDAMPRWHFREKHSLIVEASPQKVFDAIHAVTAREIQFFETLTTLRRL